ncbi:MAG: lipid II flippase MurJ [Caulobacteraceae bacterium]
MYGIGVPAFVLSQLTSRAFFAHQDTKTPMRFALISVAVNIVVGVTLYRLIGVRGIAAATSIAAWLNVIQMLAAPVAAADVSPERPDMVAPGPHRPGQRRPGPAAGRGGAFPRRDPGAVRRRAPRPRLRGQGDRHHAGGGRGGRHLSAAAVRVRRAEMGRGQGRPAPPAERPDARRGDRAGPWKDPRRARLALAPPPRYLPAMHRIGHPTAWRWRGALSR